MKNLARAFIFVFAALLSGASPLHSLAPELRNVSGDEAASAVDFGRANPGKQNTTAKQYLALRYPADNIQRQLRIYTNNKD